MCIQPSNCGYSTVFFTNKSACNALQAGLSPDLGPSSSPKVKLQPAWQELLPEIPERSGQSGSQHQASSTQSPDITQSATACDRETDTVATVSAGTHGNQRQGADKKQSGKESCAESGSNNGVAVESASPERSQASLESVLKIGKAYVKDFSLERRLDNPDIRIRVVCEVQVIYLIYT